MGSFCTFADIDVFQPIAVPCQVGPDSSKISSGGVRESEEVVKNSKKEKSYESLVIASYEGSQCSWMKIRKRCLDFIS